MNIQLPIPSFDLSYQELVEPKHSLVNYVKHLNLGRIEHVIENFYSGQGPKGFRKISFFLLDLFKLKKNISSNRKLIEEIKQQKLLQHLAFLAFKDRRKRYIRRKRIPTHQLLSFYHRKLGITGFRQLLALSVEEANELGLLEPAVKQYRQGIHLAQDSTFTPTKITSDRFNKDAKFKSFVAFGRSHKYKFPLGQRIHWLITVPKRIIVNLMVVKASAQDFNFTIPLTETFMKRHNIKVAYHIGDKGLSDDETRKYLFENHDIVSIYPLKENAVYPDSFSDVGWPLCPKGYPLKRKGSDYKRKRTQYYCDRRCAENTDVSSRCEHFNSSKIQGYTFFTHFQNGLGKFGPVYQKTVRFKKLYNTRVLTEQINSLAKCIRYHFEENLTATDPQEVEIQALIYAIVLNYDEIVKERLRLEHI